MAVKAVPLIGKGTRDDPYRADYDGEWSAVDWDHDVGEVTIRVQE